MKNIKGKGNNLKKYFYKDKKIYTPFFIYLKLNNIENANKVIIKFYHQGIMKLEIPFDFGNDGKYYDFVIFTDIVSKLNAGKYKFTVFVNDTLVYENDILIEKNKINN